MRSSFGFLHLPHLAATCDSDQQFFHVSPKTPKLLWPSIGPWALTLACTASAFGDPHLWMVANCLANATALEQIRKGMLSWEESRDQMKQKEQNKTISSNLMKQISQLLFRTSQTYSRMAPDFATVTPFSRSKLEFVRWDFQKSFWLLLTQNLPKLPIHSECEVFQGSANCAWLTCQRGSPNAACRVHKTCPESKTSKQEDSKSGKTVGLLEPWELWGFAQVYSVLQVKYPDSYEFSKKGSLKPEQAHHHQASGTVEWDIPLQGPAIRTQFFMWINPIPIWAAISEQATRN